MDNILKEGIQQQLFRDDLTIPLVRQMIFGTLDEIVTNWVMNEQKYDLNKQVPAVHDLLMKGLSVD